MEQDFRGKIDALVQQMTIHEKVAQLRAVWVYEVLDGLEFSEHKARQLLARGIGHVTRLGGASNLGPEGSARIANQIQQFLKEETRLKIPALIHEEACSGYMARGSTLFPQAIGLASSWDPDLVEQVAAIIRREMRAVGAHQALAPLLDVARDPRWGRIEETFGEDAYLVARLGVAFVRGLQNHNRWDTGVVATGKHFAGYGFSEGGLNWAPIHIPPREFLEVVLWPFEAAVKEARLESIMPGYHEYDGVPMHAHEDLLNGLLRNTWKFQGTVVSDYFAITMLQEHHHLAQNRVDAAEMALRAGVDVELPNQGAYGDDFIEAVSTGQLPEEYVDRAVRRVLDQKFRLGLFDRPMVDESKVASIFSDASSRQVAETAAVESLVLLKNEGGLLPHSRHVKRVAVVGPNAHSLRNLMGDYAYPSHIETLLSLRREGNVFDQPLPEVLSMDGVMGDGPTIWEAVRDKLADAEVAFAAGCDIASPSRDGIAEALELVEHAEFAIVAVGDKSGLTRDATSGESRDRSSLDLPGAQAELVQAVLDTGIPTVVILVAGRPVTGDWMDQAPAILNAWLPGPQGSRAIADVLFGDASPSGRLPLSFPRTVGHVPTYYNHKPSGGRSHWHGDYVDGPVAPRFAFGYGLSYTEFRYDGFEAELEGKDCVRATVQVKNVGSRSGTDVVQFYVRPSSDSVTRPVRTLKAFARVMLQPGETKTVTARIGLELMAFLDHQNHWVLDAGPLLIEVGASSADIRGSSWVNIPEPRHFDQLSEFAAITKVEPHS